MKRIPWEYDESGSHNFTFFISGLVFTLHWGINNDKWAVSGHRIAGDFHPLECKSRESADELVFNVLESIYKEIGDFLGKGKDE